MTKLDFFNELRSHDWTYEYSDDHSVWRRGSAKQSQLKQVAEESPDHKRMFEAWNNHIWKGGPKPEIEEYL